MGRLNDRHSGDIPPEIRQLTITGDSAFTGLEAAMILIAFVVVAAVFSYTILNTGFMVTQKSQEAIYSAVAQTTSTLDLYGDVYGISDGGDSTAVHRINFTCRIAPSGTPVNFGKIVLTYSNTTRLETLERDPATYNPSGCRQGSGTWSVYGIMNDDGTGNNLLEPGELFFVTACPSKPMIRDEKFTLEIKPETGVALSLTRTVPSELRAINSLY